MPLSDAAPLPVVDAGAAEVAGEAVTGRPRGRSQAAAKAGTLFLEGVKVKMGAHGVLGQPGSYRRFVVRCPNPDHRANGKACTRSKTYTDEIDADDLVLARLGVWLSKSNSIATREAHKAYAPSPEEVAAYATRLM